MLLLPILFVGCKKNNVQNEEPEAVKLAVEPNSIISPSAGADYTLTLTAPEAWTATCADSWVKVNPTSGNAGTVEISVKIAADKSSTEATSKIVFKSGDQTVEVPVKRLAKDPARLIIASETDIQTPKDGGTYAIKVESNIKWQIASNASWAKIDGQATKRDNAIISVTVDPATAPEETVATLTISPLEGSGVEKQTVTITRSASDATSMTIDKNQIDAPADGGSYSITVNTTAKWKATKSWDADWITLSNNEKTGNGSFSIKVDPATSSNDLSAVITVEEVRSDDYKPVQLNVLVTRKGKANAELSVEPTSINAPAEGGDFTITIKSNYAWTTSLIGTKIFSVSITKGDGDAIMVVSVKPATDDKEATGSITINSSFGGAKQTINIHRAAALPQLEVSPTTINAPEEGGEYPVTVTSNTDWTVSAPNTLIAISSDHGTKNGSFTITVSPAPSVNDESYKVTVKTTNGSVSKQITINQKGHRSKYVKKLFSVSDSKKVYISPGNLQYQASTRTWRFANFQFDYVGGGDKKGNVYAKGVLCDNKKISDSYTGWIDLFGWGTGNNPTFTTCEDKDYAKFVDWGVNAIDYYDVQYNNNEWRTLESVEWYHMLHVRANASSLRGLATVKDMYGNDVRGLIIMPDGWVAPDGLTFEGKIYSYDLNVYTLAQWEKLEATGAIFLPAALYRSCDGHMANETNVAAYWSNAQPDEEGNSSAWYIALNDIRLRKWWMPYGCSVRLVHDVK